LDRVTTRPGAWNTGTFTSFSASVAIIGFFLNALDVSFAAFSYCRDEGWKKAGYLTSYIKANNMHG
jgi:hypothetical protein